MAVAARPQLSHLRALESEAIHVMREVAAELEKPVLLFSGGKDSIILVRLADTLIGAAIAHLFNYLWPRWESSEAPQLASRLQAQLSAFAAAALRTDVSDHDYRLARKNVIEAIAALSDSAGRMSTEPMAARGRPSSARVP